MKQTILFVRLALLLGLLGANFRTAHATPPLPPMPPVTGSPLSYWNFNDTNWLTSLGNSPLVFTNILNVPSWNGNAVEIDHGQPAGIQYRIIESSGHTNLTLNIGTLRFWFKPNWTSTNLGGFGPGNFARLIDVGTYTTNASYGWWGLYFAPEGCVLSFAAQTNGAEAVYLSTPIAWASNDWHLITLTYSSTNSSLYLDDQLATNGPGVTYWPGAEILTNGFLIGTDSSGMAQARGQFEDLRTFDYPLSATTVSQYYQAVSSRFPQLLNGNFNAFSSEEGPPTPGGDPGEGSDGPTNDLPQVVYGTNDFYLEILPPGINEFNLYDTNSLTLFVHGTISTNIYQLLSKQSLTDSVWEVEQTFLGTNSPNLVPLLVSMLDRPSLFLRAKSLSIEDLGLDSDEDGLPDWWELVHNLDPFNLDTGDTGVSDGYKISSDDMWSNLDKFLFNWRTDIFYSPPAPGNVTARLNISNSNVTISWNLCKGTVTNYTVSRWDPATDDWAIFNVGLTNSFVDTSCPPFTGTNILYGPCFYSVEANYAKGNSLVSDLVTFAAQSALSMQVIPGPQGSAVLAVKTMPSGITSFRITRPLVDSLNVPYAVTNINVSVSLFTNGLYTLPGGFLTGGFEAVYAQAVWPDGSTSDSSFLFADIPPFYDGRVQIHENIAFLLRAANFNAPFLYTIDGSQLIEQPIDYVVSDYVGGVTGVDGLKPFIENNLFRNFVFATNDVDSTGHLTTGASLFDTFNWIFRLDHPFTYDFATSSNFTSLLSDNNTRWILPYDVGLAANVPTSIGTNLFLQTGLKNYFGLPLSSLLLAYGPTTPHFVEVSAGGYYVPPPAGESIAVAKKTGRTDTNGVFSASERSRSYDLTFKAQKEGYYPSSQIYELGHPSQYNASKWNPSLTLMLKKIGQPIPMYAKLVHLNTLKTGDRIGFDLSAGDWVSPYGKGALSDIFFNVQLDKKAANDFEYKLTISFPNPGDGIQEFSAPLFQLTSTLLQDRGYEQSGVRTVSVRCIRYEKINSFIIVRHFAFWRLCTKQQRFIATLECNTQSCGSRRPRG